MRVLLIDGPLDGQIRYAPELEETLDFMQTGSGFDRPATRYRYRRVRSDPADLLNGVTGRYVWDDLPRVSREGT